MSTPFYDLASLVVVPSGYKASKVYAQKPLTTDGQLTFSRASTATRVNASGLIETVSSNVPRLDYLGSTCPKLQLEPSRTNYSLHSEAFTETSYWSVNEVTITGNTVAAPDGATTADTFTISAATSTNHRVYNAGITASLSTATYSIFVKPNGYNLYALRESATTGASIGFNLATQTVTVTYSTGGCTASNGKVEAYSNGWYRISGTFSFSGTTAQGFGFYAAASTWTSGDVESVSFAGNGTTGAYIWGAMMENGAYATSYVKTTTAAVTRLADACSKTGISSLIGQTEGVLFVDFVVNGRANNANILNSETNTNASFFLGAMTDGKIDAGVFSNGSIAVRILQGSVSVGQRAKVAFAYKSGSSALYINGALVGTTSSTFTLPSTLDDIFLNDPTTFFNYQENVSFNQALLFKTRLTNAQLAELTTI